MSENIKLKWRIIKQVIKSDNCILISLKNNEFDYKFAGRSLMFAQLFQRLTKFVPHWFAQWLHINSVK